MRRLSAKLQLIGGHTGKIDWNLANHLYNTGVDWTEAAQKVLQDQKENGII
jgi:hypothetical protein